MRIIISIDHTAAGMKSDLDKIIGMWQRAGGPRDREVLEIAYNYRLRQLKEIDAKGYEQYEAQRKRYFEGFGALYGR